MRKPSRGLIRRYRDVQSFATRRIALPRYPGSQRSRQHRAGDQGSRRVLTRLAGRWELILVDDGSTDDTSEVTRRAMGEDASRLRLIRHASKRGYGVTVADGLRAADTDYVAFMDGDGQFDPADLGRRAAVIGGADLAAA